LHKKLLKEIKAAQIVSFDVFDTVVLRNVLEPADIFYIVRKQYEQNNPALNFDLKEQRLRAETGLRHKLQTEITLDGLYDELVLITGIDSEVANRLKQLEIKAELDFCVQNPYMYEIYCYAIETGKRIVFNSDMYLPQGLVEEILHKNGYTKYEKLYLSSETFKTKHSGESFDLMAEDLKVKPSKILHIGDNQGADILKAGSKGLKTYYYPKCKDYIKHKLPEEQKLYEKYEPDESVFKALCLNKTACRRDNNNFWFNLGYKTMGPAVYNFIQAIIDFTTEKDIKKILFASRDGYIMKKAYDIFLSFVEPGSPHNDNYAKNLPEALYFYTSRRLFHLPALVDCENIYENRFFTDCVNKMKFSTLNDFVEYFCIDKSVCESALFRQNFSMEQDFDKNKLKKLLEIVHLEIIKNAKREKEMLLGYFRQEGIFDYPKLAWIDIGWQGRVQASFENVLSGVEKAPEIYGYYFGLMENAKVMKEKMNLYGHFLDCEKNELYRLLANSPVIEFLFSAPHGSVVGLKQKNGKYVPVCNKDDYREKADIISSIHEGCLEFIRDFLEIKQNYTFVNIQKEAAISYLQRLLGKPSYKEAVNIGNIGFIDGHDGTISYLAKPPTLLKRIFSPNSVDKGFSSCLWQIGYQKRLAKRQKTDTEINMFDAITDSRSFKKKLNNFKKKYKNKKIVFYGAGILAEHFVNNTDLSELDIVGFMDSNTGKKGSKCGKYDIYHISDLKELQPDLIAVTILNAEGMEAFIQDLLDKESLSAEIKSDLLVL